MYGNAIITNMLSVIQRLYLILEIIFGKTLNWEHDIKNHIDSEIDEFKNGAN